MNFAQRAAAPLALALVMAGCGRQSAEEEKAAEEGQAGEEGLVRLTPQQIATARIAVAHPARGGMGAITLPATIEGDPQGMQVVSAAIGGKVVALTRNLGQGVRRGETLAVIESREAASLQAARRIPPTNLALQDQGDVAVHRRPGEIPHTLTDLAGNLRVGRLKGRIDGSGLQAADFGGAIGHLEAIGFPAEHQLEEDGIGRGKGHIAHPQADELGSRFTAGPLGFGGHGGAQLLEASLREFCEKVVHRGEVMRRRGMRYLRPSGTFPQGEATNALLFQELAA